MLPLTEDERWLLNHVGMWGSAGYPIRALGKGRWTWGPVRSIRGVPTVFRTKRAAVESFETYYAMLRERHAHERRAAAEAEAATRNA